MLPEPILYMFDMFYVPLGMLMQHIDWFGEFMYWYGDFWVEP